MPELVQRRCPQCGRKAHDNFLSVCPDCRVGFVVNDSAPARLTPEQISVVARQILGSWKVWMVILILIGASAWGVISVADKIAQQKTAQLNQSLEQQSGTHLRLAMAQLSNQIALQFRQPNIKSTVEQVARDRANDIFEKGVRPAVENLANAVDATARQLAEATNALASLQAQALDLQRKIQQLTNQLPAQISSHAVAVTPPAQPIANPTAESPIRLTLTDRNISRVNGMYVLTMFFHVSNPGGPTSVEIIAGAYKQTAKIVHFSSLLGNLVEPPTINDLGDFARLKLNVANGDNPTLLLELTGPTIIKLGSDSFDSDITIPVAADRMQLQTLTK